MSIWNTYTSANTAIKIKSSWNADTNSPNITGETIVNTGYIVSTSGNTNLGGISSWEVNDIAVKTSSGWAKILNGGSASLWGSIEGTLSEQTDLQDELNALQEKPETSTLDNIATFNNDRATKDSLKSFTTSVRANGSTDDLHVPTEKATRDALNLKVNTSGDETIAGIKTFSSLPILPASDPTTTNQAVRKDYVDTTSRRISTGCLTSPELTDNGNGTATISSVQANLYTTPDFSGNMITATIPSATLSFTDGVEEYISIRYNSGSPIYYKETVGATMNHSDNLPVFVIWRLGSVIHSLNFDSLGAGLANKAQSAMYHTQLYRVSIDGGLSISEVTVPVDRTVTVTEGLVYTGAVHQDVYSFNSSTDTMTFVYHVGGVWNYRNESVYNNTQYDNGTNLVDLSNNRWGVRWYYRSIGDAKQLFYVLGMGTHKSATEAALESPRADLPAILKKHCLLIGRSIIQYNATNGSTQSTLLPTYIAPAVINHNDTMNIQGGTTNEYYHLTSSQYTNLNSQGDVAGGSYTYWDSTGHQTMFGNARPWRDEKNDALSLRSQGSGISSNFTESVVEFTSGANLSDYLYCNIQLNHDRDESSIIYPHLHFFQASNAVPNFLLQYRWQINGSAKVTAWTNVRCNVVSFSYTSGTLSQIVHTPTGITPPVGSSISDIIQFRIIRDTGNISTLFSGVDSYSGSVGILSFDLHIQVNSLGSTEEYLK